MIRGLSKLHLFWASFFVLRRRLLRRVSPDSLVFVSDGLVLLLQAAEGGRMTRRTDYLSGLRKLGSCQSGRSKNILLSEEMSSDSRVSAFNRERE
jgi:hypothetical protein